MGLFTIAKGIWLWIAVFGVAAASALGIFLMTRLQTRYRRPLLATIIFVSGLFYVLEFFMPTSLTGNSLFEPNQAGAPAFVAQLKAPTTPVARWLRGRLSPAMQSTLDTLAPDAKLAPADAEKLALELNALLKGPSIYPMGPFAGVTVTPDTRRLRETNPAGVRLIRLNRVLLEEAIPGVPKSRVRNENRLTKLIPDVLTPFADSLSAMLLGLGLYSLIRIHGANVTRRRKGWAYSAALLVSAALMVIFGLWSKAGTMEFGRHDVRDAAGLITKLKGTDPIATAIRADLTADVRSRLEALPSAPANGTADPAYEQLVGDLAEDLNRVVADGSFYTADRFANVARSPWLQRKLDEWKPGSDAAEINRALLEAYLPTEIRATKQFLANETYSFLFEGLQQNMDAAMFSLISFFILSAAYRAFRIRSIEASILMASALVVLLGLSFGVLITDKVPADGLLANLRIETWSSWILTTVNTPALRAIDFGLGLGGLAMGLRLWLGIERGALFGD